MPRHDTISFLSDYGLADEFVGVVKAVIRQLAPHTTVIDVCHEVPPHDVRAGALMLARAVQYLPPGVVLAVVDPGVGTDRRAVAVEAGEEAGPTLFVGPDNGLLAPAVAMAGGARRAVALTNPDYQLASPGGATFAGRDVFAPAAAHLANGVELAELGEPVDPLSLLPSLIPVTRTDDSGALVAEVLWIDRYGNAQLNVDPDEIGDMGDRILMRFGEQVRTVRRARAYADIGPGEVGLVVDSYGLVSVCVERASAAELLGLRTGDTVVLEAPR